MSSKIVKSRANYRYIDVEFDSFETVEIYTATGKLGRKEKVKPVAFISRCFMVRPAFN